MNLTLLQARVVVLIATALVAGAGFVLVRNKTPWTKSVESPMRK